MEPISDTPAVRAELVVQTGRLKGARRPLPSPLTLIGRAAGCDVRLNADGVAATQCLLVHGEHGLLLRTVPGATGTLVNGAAAVDGPLADGDQLTIGPFHFEVAIHGPFPARLLAETTARHEREVDALRRSVESEKEALRIQAAAVVAQQVALGAEEGRLQQRRAALEQQEEQLSTHLEEKRRRLGELRDQIRADHEALRKERAAHEVRTAAARDELDLVRREVEDGREQLATDRERLRRLRHRLKHRWHRYWAAERATFRHREEAVEKRHAELTQQEERLKHDRARLTEDRLALNGAVELGRRQLQATWDEFRQEQKQESAQLSEQRGELDARRAALDERELLLADADRDLVAAEHRWDQKRHALEKEVEGLENRARNFRRKIYDEEQEVRRLEAVLEDLQARIHEAQAAAVLREPSPAPVEAAVPLMELPPTAEVAEPAEAPGPDLSELEDLTAEVADQRLSLFEQCERLARAQQLWQEQHEATAAEMEAVARRLEERELDIDARERRLVAHEDRLRQQQRESLHLQRYLEGWQARMTARQSAWHGDRDRLLADLDKRERLAEQRMRAVATVQKRWTDRRRQEVEWLQAERTACGKLRREYAGLRDDWLRRSAVLEKEERDLAERALALEQYRQEYLSQANDAAGAQRRLEKLRRRWEALSTTAAKELAEQRKALEEEAASLDEQHSRLQKHSARVEQREEELGRQQLHFEQKDLLCEDELARLRNDLTCTQAQRQRYEKQVNELRDEVERLARLLLDEVEPVRLPAAQAA